jgi:PAS domain S-box-containing protein
MRRSIQVAIAMRSERGSNNEMNSGLSESEFRFRSFFENYTDAMFIGSLDGKILAANPAAQRMFGMNEAELMAAGRGGITVKDERMKAALQELLEKGTMTHELTFRRKDGSTFPGEITSTMFKDADDSTSAMIAIRDITERKRAEDALEESETKYRGLFENLQEAVGIYKYIYDESGEVVDWIYLDANSATERELGKSRKELIGRTAFEVYGDSGTAQYLPLVREMRRTGKAVTYDHYFEPVDRYYHNVFAPMGRETFLASALDITDIKRAQRVSEESAESIRRHAEEVETIMDIVPAAIWVAHDPECRVITGNWAADTFYESMEGDNVSAGPTSGEEWDKTRRFFRDGEELKPKELPMQESAAKGVEVRNSELEVLLPSGQRIVILGNARPLFDDEGEVRGSVASFLDITERKRVEDALLIAKREWEQTFDHIPDLIAILDADQNIVRVNKAMVEHLRLPSHEHCVGLKCYRCVHGTDSPPSFCPHGQTLIDGREHVAEVHEERLGGDFLVSTTPIFDTLGKIKGTVHVARNITELKKTEEALRVSETKYRGLFEILPLTATVARYILNESGEVVDSAYEETNAAGAKAVGKMPDKLRGKRMSEVFGPEVLSRYLPILNEVRRTNRPVTIEHYLEGLDRYYISSYAPVNEELWAGSSQDISEIKKAQRRAEEERARLQAVLENIPVAVGITDAEGGIVLENGVLARIWRGKLPLREVNDYVEYKAWWPVSGEPVKPEEWPAARALKGEASTVTIDIEKLDGTRGALIVSATPILDDKGRVTGTVWTNQDITDIREVQRRTEEGEARLQTILDAAPIGIFISDERGRCVLVNDHFYRIWGANAPIPGSVEEYREYRGWYADTSEEIDPDDWPAARALRGEESSLVADIQRFDGGRGAIMVLGVPLRDLRGAVAGSIVVAQDITELKRTEVGLRRSNDELQQFAYVASHDLQEPLRMVTNYLGLLKKKFGGDLGPQAMDYMDIAMDGAERMRQLINDLLQYSRIDSQTKEFVPVDMNEIAETVLDELHVSAEDARAEIIIEPLPEVLADEQQMKQLLMNLISNAIKFRGEAPPRVEVSAVTYDHEFVFSIKDNGIGIDPRYADKLFKMFSRLHTKEEYPGTGIGLAIAKKIVEQHDGKIWFDSKPGKGTTFFFTIPV